MINTSKHRGCTALLFWIGALASVGFAGAPPVPDPVGFGDNECWSSSTPSGEPCFTDADCSTGVCGNKVRYISFTPPSSASVGGEPLAIRVTLTALDQFSEFDGEVRWVGPPGDFPLTRVPADGTFQAAALQCDPFFMNWSTADVLHVYGSEVVPQSQYEVRAGTASCVALGVDSCLSPPVIIHTNKFGDIVSSFGGVVQPNKADINAVVVGFSNTSLNAAPKPRAQQTPSFINPSNAVTVLDVTSVLQAFRGAMFPVVPPLACPRPFVGCGDGRIDPPEQCDDGNTTPGDGCDASCRFEDSTLIVALQPIQPEAPLAAPYPIGAVISENAITLPSGGVRVFLELTLADWDPDLDQDPKTGSFQATLDGSGLSASGRGSIEPTIDTCSGTCADCGLGGFVSSECMPWSAVLPPGTPFLISSADGSTPPLRFFSSLGLGAIDPGIPVRFGTLAFDVSQDAWGTFAAGFLDGHPDTFFLTDAITEIGVAELRSATITVNTGCCGNGVCTPNNGMACPAGMTAVPKCFGDCNGNGIDDACENTADCNGNQIPDTCDMADMTSLDCNGNGVPDECEPDCNSNGVPDSCDIADMTSVDCNGNGVPDECDVLSGRSTDVNADAVPDECDAASRYVVVAPASLNVAGPSVFAIRLKIIDAPPFPASVGETRWLSNPVSVDDGAGGMISVAQTQCDPAFVDWSTTPAVAAFGAGVVPGSVYEMRSATEACVMLGVESCMSPPVLHATGKWGDAAFPWGGGTQPNFADVSAEVAKFQELITAPSLTLTDLAPGVPDHRSNFVDINADVLAFQCAAYPYTGPGTCP